MLDTLNGAQGWFSYVLGCAVQPVTRSEIAVFYLVWILAFMAVNTAWDIFSPHTDRFHFFAFKDKLTTLYAGATFSSSLIVLLSTFQDAVAAAVGDFVAPLVLAGLTGILYGLAELCPYKRSDLDTKTPNREDS